MKTNSNPVVSVIIPTYNRAKVIGRSIISVLAQTYRDFELIIVDDGSTDNTEEVVKSFNDPRIYYIQKEQNRGVSVARNIGIKAARGDYIAFNDSDDEWLPTKLEKQMALFKRDEKGDLGLVLCGVLNQGLHGEYYIAPKIHLMRFDNLLSHRLDVGYFSIQFIIKRCVAAAELYFDENIRASEEWDLLLRLSRICRIDYVPEALARIHYSHDSMSTPSNRLSSSLMIRHKYNAELEARPRALRSINYDIALKYYLAKEPMSYVRHYLKSAIIAYPWHPTAYVVLAFSVLGRQGVRLYLKLQKFLFK
jgi:glycosyltransferase involved in cell wall biosynthesis